jgi:hypothetical protein
MSVAKKDRVFPAKSAVISDAVLSQLIAAGLRKDYGDLPSAVKEIGLKTGANLRAIKNWYEGRNAPSSSHLLTLARSSPSILQIVLEQVGGADLRDAFDLLEMGLNKGLNAETPSNLPSKITEKIFRIDVSIPQRIVGKLNERQLWFLGLLQQGERLKAADIAERWPVTDRSARGDVAGLADLGLIRLAGSRKEGWYVLKK